MHSLGLPARNGEPKHNTIERVSFHFSVLMYQSESSRIEAALFAVLTTTDSTWRADAVKASSPQDKGLQNKNTVWGLSTAVKIHYLINKLIQDFKVLGFKGCVCCHQSTQQCSPCNVQEGQAFGLLLPPLLIWLRSMHSNSNVSVMFLSWQQNWQSMVSSVNQDDLMSSCIGFLGLTEP